MFELEKVLVVLHVSLKTPYLIYPRLLLKEYYGEACLINVSITLYFRVYATCHLRTNLDISQIFLCGDFNSRIDNLECYIAGIDGIPERYTKDITINAYGEILIEFLVNVNLFVLNGGYSIENDVTSVSTKEASVVDFSIILRKSIHKFTYFTVQLTPNVINSCGDLAKFTATSVPDQSLLACLYLKQYYCTRC